MTRARFRTVLMCFGLFALSATLTLAADAELSPVGRPNEFATGKHTTFAVWEDKGVWYLSTSTQSGGKGAKTRKVIFSGRVTVQGDKISDGNFKGLEKKKTDAASADYL